MTRHSDTPVSLVLPVHNEAGVIEQVIHGFHEEVVRHLPQCEFIVAEDGSTDGTRQKLEALARSFPLSLHMQDQRKGYAAAARDALRLAHHPLVFFSDADGQHDPADFWRLLAAVGESDLVIGWKHFRRDPWMRLLLSRGLQLLVRILFGLHLHDVNSGFRIYRKEVLDGVLDRAGTLPTLISAELAVRAHWAGYRVTEVPVSHLPRRFGASRGLPAKTLPLLTVRLLRGLLALRRELRRTRQIC